MSKNNNNNRPNNKPANANTIETKVEETVKTTGTVDEVPVTEETSVQNEKAEEPSENVSEDVAEINNTVEIEGTEETATDAEVKINEIPNEEDIVKDEVSTDNQYIISVGKNLSDEKITLICDRLFKAGIILKCTESGEYAVGPFNSREEAINTRKNMYRVGVKGSIKEF